jgi:hypothetical protein
MDACGYAEWHYREEPLRLEEVAPSYRTPNLRWSGPLRDKMPGARHGGAEMIIDLPRVMCLRAAAQLGR